VTLLNEQRRLYGNPTDWLPNDPVIIKRMAILKERQAMKDRRFQPVGRVDPTQPPEPRRSGRQRTRKRRFGDVEE
jgi:hypothetical protein